MMEAKNSMIVRGSVGGAGMQDCVSPRYAKFLHPVDQRCSLHAQERGRSALSPNHPVARFQCTKDMIPRDFGETVDRSIGSFVMPEWLQLGHWRAQNRL